MKAFISYCSTQEKIAIRVKDFLETIKIKSFLASDSLRIASDWKLSIRKNLESCEIFIPLLSEDFRMSDWCSQELGIAYILNREIIPISIDSVHSYGFISHIQSKSINQQSLELIITEGLLQISFCNGMEAITKLLKSSGSYRYSESVFKILEPYFDQILQNDLNTICEISIHNSQIWSANLCSKQYLPDLVERRADVINESLLFKLKYQIENQKWYRETNK